MAVLSLALLSRSNAASEDHTLKLTRELVLEPGQGGLASLSILPKPGRTISKDGPVVVTLSGDFGGGLVVPKRRYRRKDTADPRADAPRFDLKVRAKNVGTYQVVVEARFWVCRKRTCRPAVAQGTVSVVVAAPLPDAGLDVGRDGGG